MKGNYSTDFGRIVIDNSVIAKMELMRSKTLDSPALKAVSLLYSFTFTGFDSL